MRVSLHDLLNQIFDWAQAVDPSQPLTTGVFVGVSGATERVSAINRTMLGRTVGLGVDLIEVFADCWELVDGRSQTRYPWTSWIRPAKESSTWFHDLVHPDGRPDDDAEAVLVRRVTCVETSA